MGGILLHGELRVPIKESFRLGIAYCGSVELFDPGALPKESLQYAQYSSHLLFSTPTTGLIVLSGVGENEFGLFKALVCINPDEAVMTTIKSYFHDQSSPTGGYIVGGCSRAKGESLGSIRKRLLDPANRKRQAPSSKEAVDVCDVCCSSTDKSLHANNASSQTNQLVKCCCCGLMVHPVAPDGGRDV